MLRCKSRSRLKNCRLAIREGELDFAAAAIRFSEGPESAQGGRLVRFLRMLVIQSSNVGWPKPTKVI